MNNRLDILTRKKQELGLLRPLPKELEQSLEEWFDVELTYNELALSGNTLTREEVKKLFKK